VTSIETGLVCSCITCSDQGTEMVVLDVDLETGLACCREATDRGEPHAHVDVELVAPVAAGDVVLVHAGVALVLLAKGALA
jgi:hydrogenase maturation factor